MDRTRKSAEISGLSEKFGKAKAAFLIDFKGMSVEEVTNLRKKLRPAESEMKVVRNTLAKRALKDYPNIEKAITDEFVGTNAVVFAYGDVAAPAKTLVDYSKQVERLVIKSGVMEGEKLNSAKVKYLATLPPKDVLRAQMLGLLQAPMSKFLGTLQAAPGQFVRVLAAYRDKQNG